MPFAAPVNVVVLHGDAPALIDTGFAAAGDALVDALASLGLRTGDVAKVLLTSLQPEAVGNIGLFEEATVHVVGDVGAELPLREHLRSARAEVEARARAILAGPDGHPEWDPDEVELGLDVLYFGAPDVVTVLPVGDDERVAAAGRALRAIHAPGVDDFGAAWFDTDARLLVGGETLSREPRARFRARDTYGASLAKLGSVEAEVVVASHGLPDRSPGILFRSLSLGASNLAQNIPFALDGPTSPVMIAYRDLGRWPRDLVHFSETVARYQRVLDEMVGFGVATVEGEGPWAPYSMERPSRM
jgi:glyoxylase-like metal-dependent hydrolase (beta-lactamase superfamily II)